MKITKIGHCCLLIEVSNLKILTDPGAYSSGQNELTDIDVVLITHEHADHLHTESVQKIIANNPNVQIFTNSGVGKKLDELGIKYELLEGTETREVSGVMIEAFDCQHEEIYQEIGRVQNTGYFIGGRLFYPGDSFGQLGKPVEVLALPIAGPWCRLVDALDYCIQVKPKYAFPVHDGMIQEDKLGPLHRVPAQVLANHDIEFVVLKVGEARGF